MKKSQNNLTCSDHSKPIEGYCKDCQAYICASCMFGSGNPHKSHTLISLDELADFLRELMDKNTEVIRHEYCEGRSLDVRQAKKSLETQTNQLIERITKCTNIIISTITKRKDELIKQLQNNMQTEIEKLNEHDAIWNQKTKIAQHINKLQIDYNDESVYSNMQFIMKGIEMLKEPLKQYEYNSVTDYQDNIIYKNETLSIEDFMNMISEMFIIGNDDIIQIPYKA